MYKTILLFCCLALLGACSGLKLGGLEDEDALEEVAIAQSVSSHALLACVDNMESIGRKEFDTKFKLAEAELRRGREVDKLRFICLSLNAEADYEQFKHGTRVLEQYIEEHPNTGKDLQGFRILVNRLDHAIENKWSSWKTLLNDKKALKAKIKSLKARVEELQQQIEQLKDIEEILESREIGQP